MEFSNDGQSFYHRFQGSFLRDGSGQLLHCTGPNRQWVQENWSVIGSPKAHSAEDSSGSNIKLHHNSRSTDGSTLTVMVRNDPEQTGRSAFEDFFVHLILEQADLCAHCQPLPSTVACDSATEQVVDLFDSFLRYQGKEDKWAQTGRSYFAERVRHFTAQGATIELCLPAFPCKSSNRDKVTGLDPDWGEELALERLHDFVEAVERLYQPGAKLWIISDGHVFSDCIGVNDGDVDAYGEKLREMNHELGLRRGKPGRVGFKSLVDLFQLAAVESQQGLSGLARRLDIPSIEHHINTRVTEEAELCRRILMAGCGPRKSAVRARVDSKDPAITALYRGFTRFMLEDLEHLPHAQTMSKSQQKKLSAKVAFEMILRNQAYSNLVEMLFPNHIRLSIHAHNNAGPKFGIQLFDPSRVRAVEALSPNGELMTSLDLLHIPTPWHNSVVQLAGSDVILVTKAKLARAALATGCTAGGLVKTEHGRAFFALQKRAMPTPEPEGAHESESESEAVTEARVDDDVELVEGKDGDVTVTVTVTVMDKTMEKTKLLSRATLSQKADAVVTAVVRRTNSGTFTTTAPEISRHDRWLGRLRWILSLFWPQGL